MNQLAMRNAGVCKNKKRLNNTFVVFKKIKNENLH